MDIQVISFHYNKMLARSSMPTVVGIVEMDAWWIVEMNCSKGLGVVGNFFFDAQSHVLCVIAGWF